MAEAFSIAYRGVLWAIVLAWLAAVVHKVGWNAFPMAGLPIFSAWILGETRGYRKGFVEGKIFGKADPGKELAP